MSKKQYCCIAGEVFIKKNLWAQMISIAFKFDFVEGPGVMVGLHFTKVFCDEPKCDEQNALPILSALEYKP